MRRQEPGTDIPCFKTLDTAKLKGRWRFDRLRGLGGPLMGKGFGLQASLALGMLTVPALRVIVKFCQGLLFVAGGAGLTATQ